ncbi:hypothetical protein A6R68_18496 [Neotoma lepida]|uniref:P2X purinoceptor n=1 Tax=Neotoma lepida TaxID=56216 RepID=A0A1A6HKQ5_NEOLE|nr:hypothetical protein A6R68_18496 [Neotoma lepida]
MPACCSWNDVLQYETNKVTRIQSMNYGTIKWVLHVIVFSYVGDRQTLLRGTSFLGSWEREPSHHAVCGPAMQLQVCESPSNPKRMGRDSEEYLSSGHLRVHLGNSFFVMTNFLKSEGQEQKLCPEVRIQTGRCIPYDDKKKMKTCEVFAWCPAEEGKEAPRPALLRSAENFTTQNPRCPIFRLGDIFQEAGENFSEVAIQVGGVFAQWLHGGIMGIEIYWDCNLDSWSHHCYPKYSFRRLDDKYTNESLVPGYNFRSSVYPYCTCCEPCAVNEYYYRKKCELVMEPKRTLKYVSFVDEPHIRMVDQQLLGTSLQVVKGQEVPRPQMDITNLSRLSLSLHDSPLTPGQPEEMQLLQKEVAPKSGDSPGWCQCGKCLPSRLPENRRALEELCCRRKPGPCITTSELFWKLVLSRQALQLLLLYQEPLLVLEEEDTNRRLRHCAYRCYAIWRFGSQDMADFAILPSCCRWRIRKEFPKTEGQYSGFKYPY